MMLVITCLLMLMLMLMLLLLTRCRVRVLMLVLLVLLVRQSFVVHGGLEAQLLLVLLRPGLLLLAEGVVEGGVLLLLAGIGVGVEEGSGEVEQGVLLGEVEVVHCAWDGGLHAIYRSKIAVRAEQLSVIGQPRAVAVGGGVAEA